MRESSSDTGSGSKRQQCTKNSQNNHDRTAKLTNSTGTMTYCCGENPNKRHNYGDHAFEDSFLISRNRPSSDSDSRPPPQHRLLSAAEITTDHEMTACVLNQWTTLHVAAKVDAANRRRMSLKVDESYGLFVFLPTPPCS